MKMDSRVTAPYGTGGYKRWAATSLAYAAAVILVFLATGAHWLMKPIVGDSAPYMTYFLACAMAIRFLGLGSSLFAILLSTLAGNYFFIGPPGHFAISSGQLVGSGIFLVTNLIVLGLAESMRRTKAELETLIEAVPAGVWISNRPDCLNMKGNRTARECMGASEAHDLCLGAAAGRRPALEVRRNGAVITSDQLPMQQAAATGQPVLGDEIEFVRVDGTSRHLYGNAVPLFDEHGKVRGCIGALMDITDRKRMEEAWRESETLARRRFSELSGIMENAPLGLLVAHDPSCREISTNRRAADLLGLDHDQNASKSAVPPPANYRLYDNGRELMPDELPMQVAGRTNQPILDKELQLEVLGQPGRVHLLVNAAPLCDAAGQSAGVVCAIVDITERKQMWEELVQAKEALRVHAATLEKTVQERTARLQELVEDLEHFSFTLTHDLRAPLRAMNTYAQMMLQGDCAGCVHREAKDFLQRILSSARRMDTLITDALAYSRAVRNELILAPIDMAKLVGTVIQSYPHLQGMQANITVDSPFPLVMGNEAALTQCVSNLLLNALKFVAPGTVPRVRVWAEAGDHCVRLWFEDNGIGIPKESQEKIFDMFYRGSREYEGTGIGLALVRKNVERMGGKVGVASEPGKGSRFWLHLQPVDMSC